MRQSTRRRSGVMALAAVLMFPIGCSHAPGVSNGSVSVCYRAIPVGRRAIHDQGAKLIGVHRVPLDTVRSHLPPAKRAELAAENDTAVCAMAFRGAFRSGQVDLAPAGQSGGYAIVLVSSLHIHLVGSIVLDSLPRSFGGRTV